MQREKNTWTQTSENGSITSLLWLYSYKCVCATLMLATSTSLLIYRANPLLHFSRSFGLNRVCEIFSHRCWSFPFTVCNAKVNKVLPGILIVCSTACIDGVWLLWMQNIFITRKIIPRKEEKKTPMLKPQSWNLASIYLFITHWNRRRFLLKEYITFWRATFPTPH